MMLKENVNKVVFYCILSSLCLFCEPGLGQNMDIKNCTVYYVSKDIGITKPVLNKLIASAPNKEALDEMLNRELKAYPNGVVKLLELSSRNYRIWQYPTNLARIAPGAVMTVTSIRGWFTPKMESPGDLKFVLRDTIVSLDTLKIPCSAVPVKPLDQLSLAWNSERAAKQVLVHIPLVNDELRLYRKWLPAGYQHVAIVNMANNGERVSDFYLRFLSDVELEDIKSLYTALEAKNEGAPVNLQYLQGYIARFYGKVSENQFKQFAAGLK